MKIWLDDVRVPPDHSWVWTRTATETIDLLLTGLVKEISLDHDLGLENETGYTVALWIEEKAYAQMLPKISWKLHSANPVGIAKMRVALNNANRFWDGDRVPNDPRGW